MISLLLVLIYFVFISLGLPDAILGAAWPVMYPQFDVPVSYMGIVSMIISFGTVTSSLHSDMLTKKFGTPVITAVSVGMTCAALFGFSTCSSFRMLCLWAVPYGLGAGSVDAAINNYVAVHYESRHMSWLHCMWGVGATIGPFIMGSVLTGGRSWNTGYRAVGLIQLILTAVIIFSLPAWKKQDNRDAQSAGKKSERALSIGQVLSIPGAKELLTMFFCYCALEQTAIYWASSYLVLAKGVSAEHAAKYASMFCIGITAGRFVSGFVTIKLDDIKMIRLGQGIIAAGIALMLFAGKSEPASVIGLIMIGIGCAPIYPCALHSTPDHFGADRSQAIIGIQMAFAYIGSLAMPAVFGVIGNAISVSLFPLYLLLILALMFVMHERMLKKI